MIKVLFRTVVLAGLFAGFLFLIPQSEGISREWGVSVERVGGPHYGDRRPFSWYYPYNYQYYYPPRDGYNSCHWIYSNGTYFYSCD